MEKIVKILSVTPVTHDVKCFRLEKPPGYSFVPGQATDVAINLPDMRDKLRPFTFTALNEQDYLEFTIKRYPDHHGVTDRLHQLKAGDELLVHDVWGAISYQGPGYFIAGGAGITPFMAILRQLHKDDKLQGNTLIFSNKTAADIIYEQELASMLGNKALFILTQEKRVDYEQGHIDEAFLRTHVSDFTQHFYVCGPDKMIQDIIHILEKSGANADTVVFEK